MKKILLLFMLSPFVCSHAQEIEKGYHGSIEAGYSINTGGTISIDWTEINTIHGYQVPPNLFVGAGVGFHFTPEMKKSEIDGRPHWKRDNKMEIPFFADFRWTILSKKISPFVDLRLGHNVSNGSGMYSSLGAGCRFALKKNQAVYAIAAFSSHKLKFEESYMINGVNYSYTWAYKEIEENQSAISIKVGFEF